MSKKLCFENFDDLLASGIDICTGVRDFSFRVNFSVQSCAATVALENFRRSLLGEFLLHAKYVQFVTTMAAGFFV